MELAKHQNFCVPLLHLGNLLCLLLSNDEVRFGHSRLLNATQLGHRTGAVDKGLDYGSHGGQPTPAACARIWTCLRLKTVDEASP